ncbi:peptidylprolyl isomerase [Benzoatithermus flavus]|uniref:Parvulin-like PPIase n=1 Tax=Benzoatithermus flavus TaxID=3108223 RepID=A0ABU8XNF3_9PROT
MPFLRLAIRWVVAVLVLAGSSGTATDAVAQATPQRIAAVVNDDIVTVQDLADRLDLALVTSGLPNQPEARRSLAPQVLRGVIDEKLELQEAKRLGLDVTEAEIDQAMDTIAARNNTTRADLVRYLTAHNIKPATLRSQLKAQIAWIKVIAREVRPRIVVTQEQIDLALKRGASGNGDTELLLSEILLPIYDRAQEGAVLDDARRLVATIRSGGDFAALARQVSVAASAENGGDLGWVRASSVLPDLRDKVMALQPGQVSDPVVSPAGVHIFQLRDRRNRAANAAVDPDKVRQTLEQEQLERQANRYLRDLRKDAFIDIRL